MNLYVPLSMILAGALPLSTGKQSYTSPFLLEAYSRGRHVVRLGIIDSLSITRGVGNMGWNKDEMPMGIDVSFSIKDLSSVMHAPIDSGSYNPIKGIFDEDNAFNDYLGTLSSLSMADQMYASAKISLNLARKIAQVRSWWTPANLSNQMLGGDFGRFINTFTRDAQVSISH